MKCGLFTLGGFLIAFLTSGVCLADVIVSGYTYQLNNDGNYTALPGVEIQAYRRGPILNEPVRSGEDGSFQFTVSSGPPFKVVFFGPNEVPELHLLAGKDSTNNAVHITLLTPEQSRTLEISPAKKLEHILEQIRGDDLLIRKLREYRKDLK